MPWRIKREVILIVCAAAVLALAVVVLILNRDTASDLLAVIGILGGVAIVTLTLPAGGGGET